MDSGADRNYLAYLHLFYNNNNNPPHALTFGETNPPKRSRIGRDPGANGGKRTPLGPDSGRPRKRRKESKEKGLKKGKEIEIVSQSYDSDYHNYLSHMKVLERGIGVVVGGEVVVRYEKEVESGGSGLDGGLEVEAGGRSEKKGASSMGGEEVEKAPVVENESVDAQVVGCARVSENNGCVRKKEHQSEDCGRASCEPETMNPHLQGFILLVKKLCPVKTTIYPGFTGNKSAIVATGEPSTITNVEKRPNREEKRATNGSSPKGFLDFDWIEDKGDEEVPKAKRKIRCKGNRSSCIELKGLAAFPDLPDSDEEPQIDEIPRKILRRPPSDYKDKLIKELRRPFDKSEYMHLMNEATFRKKKVVYKELRSVHKAVVTDEESKSMFDFYPEFKTAVEGAKYLRQLTLLRGFFFWLKNCCSEGSFLPWEKGFKEFKGHNTK